MCRFTMYIGPSLRLSKLLTEPAHSLINQSLHSVERRDPLNGDGFGVAWYEPELMAEPAIFRSIQPAWNDANLIDLARAIESPCILAHVRAASPGLGVNQDNCHPFRRGRLAAMHNGDIGGFARLKRALLDGLSDESFGALRGSTDSEHLFAVILDRYNALDAGGSAVDRLATALRQAVAHVLELARRHAPEARHDLNVAVADGSSAVVSRFTTRAADKAQSLHYSEGQAYSCEDGVCRMLDPDTDEGSVIVSSEPLSKDPSWKVVPPQHLVKIEAGQLVGLEPF